MELSEELQIKIANNIELNEEELEQLNEYVAECEEIERKEEEKRQAEIPPIDLRTDEEKILDGDLPLPKNKKIVDGRLMHKTPRELFDDGIMSKEDFSKHQRMERDCRLNSTDKYVLPDFPITEEQRTKVLEYREYLRHLPEDPAWPDVDIKGLDIK